MVSEPYEAGIPVGSASFVEFDVTESMSGPVYVYYELTNFYQNNRRYVESVDSTQLEAGNAVSVSTGVYSANCDPSAESVGVDAVGVKSHKQLYPCGLVATSVFNDTFTLSSLPCGSTAYERVSLDESPSTISWSQDVEKKFNQANPFHKTPSEEFLINSLDMWILRTFPPQVCLPKDVNSPPTLNRVATYKDLEGFDVVACDFMDISNPACNFDTACIGDWEVVKNPSGWGINNGHFINWMRTAGLSTFRKLYGKIDRSFETGDKIRVGVQSNFPAESYGGTKRVVLSTVSWAGGKNLFLGIAYVVVGCMAFMFACVYAFVQYKHPHRLSDIDYLDWNTPRPARRTTN